MRQEMPSEYYRVLFERSPCPISIYDPTILRFRDVNDAALCAETSAGTA